MKKKVLALVMAAAMTFGTMGMSTTAFAATPIPSDSKEIEVDNVGDATLTAYQIIDGDYNTNGFLGFIWNVDYGTNVKKGARVENAEAQVTPEMVAAIAKNPTAYKLTGRDVTTNKTLEVGTWIIVATPKDANPDKIFNPMIASVYYSAEDGSIITRKVDANSVWSLNSTNAYAKSTTISIDKEITEDDEEIAVGQNARFTITGTIPSYSAEYTNVKYDVTDTLKNGLALPNNFEPVVKVGETTLTEGDDGEYTLTKREATETAKVNFVISFKPDYIKSLVNKTEADRAVTITYEATVTEDAITAVGENHVQLNYTTSPSSTQDGVKEDTEYFVTVSLDGVVKKVDEDAKALAGMTFTLATNPTFTENAVNYTTQADGDIEFAGLDADNTYYLKETGVTDGYTINGQVYQIVFNNIVKDPSTGKPTKYDVIVNEVTVDAQGNATVTKTGVGTTIDYGMAATTPSTTVVNTKMSNLPSTGGIGTTIFTIGGCVIMIAAAGIFFVSRKKENENK